MKNDRVTVLGAGLAGCEAAFQLAERGIAVSLVEMRPIRRSPAHKTDLYGELVCSNSLRSDRLQNGAGLLKEEMRRMGSLIVSAADETRVPAGGALAVDREGFARLVTERIRNHPNRRCRNRPQSLQPGRLRMARFCKASKRFWVKACIFMMRPRL